MPTVDSFDQDLAKYFHDVLSMNDLQQIAIYDKTGTLMAFSMKEGDKSTLGYTYRLPNKVVYKVATLAKGDVISTDRFKNIVDFNAIPSQVQDKMPKIPMVQFGTR